MSGGTTEVHRDTEPLITGAHDGASGATTLRDMDAGFRSFGARIGLAIENVTQNTLSKIATVTETEITTDDGISWDRDDVCYIYKTATKGSVISTNWCDLSRGWKSRKTELHEGWRSRDVDLDRDNPGKVFGPGQPSSNKGHRT